MDNKHLEIYARLAAMSAIHEATVKANPIPHLTRAARRIGELEAALSNAHSALMGLDDVQYLQPDVTSVPMSIAAVERVRNVKARDIIAAALQRRA